MPVIIEELTTNLEIEDEAKIRKVIRDEVQKCFLEFRRAQRSGAAGEIDPADPAAAGGPQESGGG
jgi:hypothetical protein